MEKDKIPIYNISIDPLEDYDEGASGLDKIAHVFDPAIDEVGIYMSAIEGVDIDDSVLKDEILNYLRTVGIELPTGWEEKSLEDYNRLASSTSILQLTNDPTARESRRDIPDSTSGGEWLVRYKYVGPKDEKNRNFCSEILSINRIYTEEEIKNGLSNSEFGQYSIFDYKGSYGCRHKWERKIYFNRYKDDTVRAVSSAPAIEATLDDSDATTYNAYLSQEFKLSNVEKQQVVAPLLIPDKLIDRINEEGGLYKIVFTKEVIAEIRKKAEKEGKLKSLNIMKDTHRGGIAPSFIIEDWIIEDESDKAYTEYGFDIKRIPVGSWMVITQVIDREFWEKEIKQNKKYSYSIEAFLNMKLTNLKLSKMEKKEQEVKMALPTGTYEINGKLYKIDEAGVITEVTEEVKVEAEDTEAKDEVKVEAETEEAKDEEKVEAETEEAKDEVKVEAETEEAKDEEKVEAETEEAKDEVKVEAETEDEKWEAVYEEIAEIKALIKKLSGTDDEVEKVEMSKDVFGSIQALKKQRKVFRL